MTAGIKRREHLADGQPNMSLQPPWAQQPPICLAHHLRPLGCQREACEDCHAYLLTPTQTAALGREVARTACLVVRRGLKCREGKECVFMHPPGFDEGEVGGAEGKGAAGRASAQAAHEAMPTQQHSLSALSAAAAASESALPSPKSSPPTPPPAAITTHLPSFSPRPSALAAARAARAQALTPPIVVPARPGVDPSTRAVPHATVRSAAAANQARALAQAQAQAEEDAWDGAEDRGVWDTGEDWDEGGGQWDEAGSGYGRGGVGVDHAGELRMKEGRV